MRFREYYLHPPMKINDQQSILTVSEVTSSIKKILEHEYRFVRICGEISNLRTPFSGHSYFTLKDDNAQIRGVLFKQQKRFIELTPQNGQEVICFGRITVYDARGEYQLIIDSIELEGTGRLQLAFDALKKKLQQRGYFRAEIKKELPFLPRKIVVVTSPTGAAIQDFLKIDSMRKSATDIQIYPVKVQGEQAATEISQALYQINSYVDDVDAIVLCRGGGSLEDLWAFNEEPVAKAIYESDIPVITGIGHEIDFTIADFCADYRSPTPTAAAEKIIPDSELLLEKISMLSSTLFRRMHRLHLDMERRLKTSCQSLARVKNHFKNEDFRLQMSKSYILQAMENNLREKQQRLASATNRLETQAPSGQIALQSHQLRFLTEQLKERMQRILEQKEATFIQQSKVLNSVSPLATLERGYSIVRLYNREDNSFKVVTDSKKAKSGDTLSILLHKGEINCVVQEDKT